ncbi:hydroxymethylglutaryl-coenzyme A reductase-domain containing protein [Nitzschia inconspicua]|uniref:3-hydroxy-3-methylglutaryl coenzyme A reductase n=1 Tax=Nitzschia inconspicua TaxID=303405 RepID=A0A9K3LU87_9STRA|nr:hydroxymethylglutaryl-coenzyme A reductase-domain containing protein [Nitzschia inconspicua]
MAAAMGTMPTIGMRLDAMIDQIDNLSSTQLYGIIVAATVGLCVVLLGTGSSNLDLQHNTTAKDNLLKKPAAVPKGRQPKWHIFKWINYLAVVAFLWSVCTFCLNASHYLHHESQGVLVQFLVGWSVFLLYFFGFFGVSFIHEDISNDETPASSRQPSSSKNVTKQLHKAAPSAPVCSDPASFKVAASSHSSTDIKELADEEIAELVLSNKVKDHELEKRLDPFRAVTVRRLAANRKLSTVLPDNKTNVLDKLPATPSLDYARVHGANCEIVVGYVPLPVGLVGPLTLNGETVYVPMATTEGCLVASTNRGAKAITQGGGAQARIIRDGITRAPCVRMGSAMEAADLKMWCEEPENFDMLKRAFESTTSFGKLLACHPTVAGKNVYLRLVCFSGDAMGMNMVSKGSLAVIELLQKEFPSLQLVALSGNMCTDKKAAATNWLQGRGKSVVVEAVISKEIVLTTLKTTVAALVHTNTHKNLIGSAMAGSLGGFNAHASNIVTAIFLATGQDPAQNVESSNCITLMEETEEGDLWISCTMPSIEVGTVGGGTSLEAQAACLEAIGCKGGGNTPGENSKKLATVVAAATMAGELSLLAALAANTLVQAHMTHNRKSNK